MNSGMPATGGPARGGGGRGSGGRDLCAHVLVPVLQEVVGREGLVLVAGEKGLYAEEPVDGLLVSLGDLDLRGGEPLGTWGGAGRLRARLAGVAHEPQELALVLTDYLHQLRVLFPQLLEHRLQNLRVGLDHLAKLLELWVVPQEAQRAGSRVPRPVRPPLPGSAKQVQRPRVRLPAT